MKTAEDILYQFKIVATEQRVALLKLMLRLENSPFSVHDLNDWTRTAGLTVSHNTLVTTLLLLVTRKVLRTFPSPKTEKKKGRPCMLYIIDPVLVYTSSNTQVSESIDKTEDVKAMDFPLKEAASVKKNS